MAEKQETELQLEWISHHIDKLREHLERINAAPGATDDRTRALVRFDEGLEELLTELNEALELEQLLEPRPDGEQLSFPR